MKQCTTFLGKAKEVCIDVSKKDRSTKTDISPMFFALIVDNVMMQLTERFREIQRLRFLKLLDHSCFSHYAKQFSDDLLNLCVETFPSRFDKCRLLVDLNGLYVNHILHRSPNDLLTLFDCQLQTSFTELTKLLKLVITIPCTSVSVERSFSAMKRIKTFYRSRMTEERLNGLAFLNIEKQRLVKLM